MTMDERRLERQSQSFATLPSHLHSNEHVRRMASQMLPPDKPFLVLPDAEHLSRHQNTQQKMVQSASSKYLTYDPSRTAL